MMKMRAIPGGILLLIGAIAAAFGQKPQDPSFHIENALVSIPVFVGDGKGRYITGLGARDFVLIEDGIPQPITFYATAEEPLSVALLLDTSKSTFGALPKIKKAARSFIRQLRVQDRAVVISFDSGFKVLGRLSGDREYLEESVQNALTGSADGTKLRDALVEVTSKIFKPILGRKAIVVLTDGEDFGSQTTEPALRQVLGQSDAIIYPIFFHSEFRLAGIRMDKNLTRRRSEHVEKATAFLQEVAELSAGKLFQGEVDDLKKNFAQIADELRHQYLLGFNPAEANLDGKIHALRVQVSDKEFSVRERRSYIALKK